MRYVIAAVLFVTLIGCGQSFDRPSSELTDGSTGSLGANDCPWVASQDLLLSNSILSLQPKSIDITRPVLIPPFSLSVVQVKQDYNCLRFVFEKVYGGVELNRKSGIDLVDRLDQQNSRVHHPIDPSTLLQNIFSLHAGAPDTHLLYELTVDGSRPSLRKSFGTNRLYRLTSTFDPLSASGYFRARDPIPRLADLISCEGMKPFPLITEQGDQGTIFVGQAEGDIPKKVLCKSDSGTSVTVNAIQEIDSKKTAHSNAEFSYKILENGVIYVRIPAMNGMNDKKRAFIEYIKDSNHDAPLLIDLRQNHGGGDEFAEELESALKSTDEPLKNVSIVDKMSVASAAGFLNFFYLNLFEANQNGTLKAALDNFFVVRDFYHATAKSFSFSEVRFDATKTKNGFGTRVRKYQKPVAVLFDKGCASECETVIESLKGWKNAILMGTPSYGAIHMSNAGRLVLPNSKIVVGLGYKASVYDAMTDAPEASGHAPHFFIIESDPKKTLNAAIKQLVLSAP